MYVPLIIGCTSTSEIVCTVYYNYKLIRLECAVKFRSQLSGQVDTELSRQRIAPRSRNYPSSTRMEARCWIVTRSVNPRQREFSRKRNTRISPIFSFFFLPSILYVSRVICFHQYRFCSTIFLLFLSFSLLFFFQYFSINRRRISLMEYIYIARCTNIAIYIFFLFRYVCIGHRCSDPKRGSN